MPSTLFLALVGENACPVCLTDLRGDSWVCPRCRFNVGEAVAAIHEWAEQNKAKECHEPL